MSRVHLVEDDAAVATSLEALLSACGYACRHFDSGEAFLAAIDDPPDCVLLDIRLPGRDGLAVLEEFRTIDALTPVIVMTGHGDVTTAVSAMRIGAQDFVEKPFDGYDLVARITAAIRRAGPDLDCRERVGRLTPRETQVLEQIVAGHPNKVAAYNLGISPKTVELHRSRIMDKTGARSVPHLVRIALRGGVDIAPLV